LFGAAGFRRVFLIYALIVCVVSLLQWFAGNGKIFWLFDTQEKAGMGPFLNYDHYASFMALALPIGLFEMARSEKRRWVYAVISAVLYASVIASGSRAGFLLNTAEIFLVVVLVGFNKRSILLEVGLIVVFGGVVGWGYLYERFQYNDPYAGRREIALATVDMVKANPWHGYGLGTWTEVYPAFAKKDLGVFINAAHNDWLQWASDGGIPMAGCILVLFGGSVVILRRAPWAMGVPIVFVHGIIDFPMQGRFLPSVVFLLFGVAVRHALEVRQSVRFHTKEN
jgi:O-antigen ligase